MNNDDDETTRMSIDTQNTDVETQSSVKSQPSASSGRKRTSLSGTMDPTLHETQKVLKTIGNYFEKVGNKCDDNDVFGQNVGNELRSITNNTQKIIAKSLINRALFLAQLGKLKPSHEIQDVEEYTIQV